MSDYLIIDNGIKIPTKVALTPKEQQIGLMYQENPGCMTFLYPSSKIRKFWMKNTPCNLLILFYQNNSLVDSVAGMAYNETSIGPDKPTNKVIEIPLFLAKNLSITNKSNIDLKLSFNTFKKYCFIKYNL
jgi:uncharacterized membrane protein (UPF0127 family)